jgi:hypothetical protein
MRRPHLLALLPAAALAACSSSGSQPVEVVPSVSLSHFIVYNTDASGTPVSVADRSVLPELMTVVEYDDGSSRTATTAWVVGVLPGGTSIPRLEGLTPRPGSPPNFLRTVISNDGFLDQVTEGSTFALGRYSVRSGSKLFTGYRVAGDTPVNIPTSGTATYTGAAHATMFGSTTGARDVSGNAQLVAAFGAGTGAIAGRLTNLTANGAPVGYELALNPTALSGASYLGGTLSVTHPGGAASGANVYSGNWQGQFFGEGARAATGTFTIGAHGVPMAGGGTESVQGVGGFGGER